MDILHANPPAPRALPKGQRKPKNRQPADGLCKNGENCVHFLALGQPAKLSRWNNSPRCLACRERDVHGKPSRTDKAPALLEKKPWSKLVKVGYAPRNKYSFLYGLKDIMEKKDISGRELAGRVGAHPDTICTYRLLRTRCHPERMEHIANVLGVTVEELKGVKR